MIDRLLLAAFAMIFGTASLALDLPNGNVRATGTNSQFQAYGLSAGINFNFGQYYDENGHLQILPAEKGHGAFISASAPDSEGVIRKAMSISSHFTDTASSKYKTVMSLISSGVRPGDSDSSDDLWLRGWSWQGAAFFYDSASTNPPGRNQLHVYGQHTIRFPTTGPLLALNNLTDGQARIDFQSNSAAKAHIGLAGGLLGSSAKAANDMVVVAQAGQDIILVVDGGGKSISVSSLIARLQAIEASPAVKATPFESAIKHHLTEAIILLVVFLLAGLSFALVNWASRSRVHP